MSHYIHTAWAVVNSITTKFKSIIIHNWRYLACYSLGTFASLLFSFHLAYKLSGYENTKQFLFAIYLKQKAQQYNAHPSNWRLSKYIAVRPSSVLCVLDEFYFSFIRFGGDKIKRQKYIARPLREKVEDFKALTCAPSAYDINPTLLPFGSNTKLIHKYIQEVQINGFRSLKINYPGTESKQQNVNIILAFHGGSNCGGAPEHFRSYLVLLSKFTNATCYSVGYGLAPKYIMPSQVNHVIQAYHEILDEYKDKGVHKIFLSGHSGGTNIVLLALQKMIHDKDKRYPDGVIALSGNVDRALDGETFITNDYRDAAIDKEMFMEMEQMVVGNVSIDGIWKAKEDQISLKEAHLSPLYGEVKGLCDLYVYVGLNECLLSQNQEFIEKCKANHVDVEYEFNEWLPHNGPLLCDTVPEARDCVVRIGEWIKNRL